MAEEDFGSWDDEDFDLDAGFSKPAEGNQWEGEDEGLDIKELTAAVAETTTPASAEDKAKEKKTKAERIAEKKAKRREEVVKPPSEKQQQQAALTPEEQMKNKLELERIQRESDLKIAMETFGEATAPSGGGGGGGGGLIDSMQPKSSEDFELLQKAITDKLKPHESSPFFVGFMETLLRESCVGLDVEDLRRLSSTLSLLASEKQKTKVVVKSKKKGKALKVGKGAKKEALDYDGGDLGGEFDDYM